MCTEKKMLYDKNQKKAINSNIAFSFVLITLVFSFVDSWITRTTYMVKNDKNKY